MAFDPDKYLKEQESFDPDKYLKKDTTTSFDPDKYLEQTATQPELTDLQKEQQGRSFFDRPVLRAEEVKDTEIKQIAERYKVSPEKLKELAPFFGANVEGAAPTELAKEAAGFVGDVLLGAPQKLFKLSQEPSMEQALDALQNLAAGRKSYVGFAGEVLTPVGPLAATGKLATRLAKGAGIGAVAGASGAQSGEELEGALAGAALGGALGGVLGRRTEKFSGAPEDTTEMLETLGAKGTASRVADIEDGAEAILSSRKQVDDIVDDSVVVGTKIESVTADPMDIALRVTATPEEATRLVESAGQNPTKLLENIAEVKTKNLASDIANKNINTVEEAREVISEYSARQGGSEAVKKRLEALNRQEARDQYIDVAYIRDKPPFNQFVTKVANITSDPQFVLRSIDEKLGTNTEAVHRALNRKKNAYLHALDAVGKEDDLYAKNISKLGATKEAQDGTLLKAIEEDTVDTLPKNLKEAARLTEQRWNEKLELVNNPDIAPGITPLSIPRRERYVRSQVKPIMDVVSEIRVLDNNLVKTAQELLNKPIKSVGQLTRDEFKLVLNSAPNSKEIMDVATFLNKGEAPTTGKELANILNSVTHDKETYSKLSTIASAAEERQDVIPSLLRENNMFALMDSWNRGTLRHVFLRDELNELKLLAKSINKTGDEESSRYVNDLLRDLSGIRSGTAASLVNSLSQSTVDRLNKVIETNGADSFKGKVAGTIKATPAILHSWSMQIYPNMLGLSPRALILNATQPFVKLMPELGGVYGPSVVARAVADTTMNLTEAAKKVIEYNLAPPDFSQSLQNEMAKGIQQSLAYKAPAKAIDQISKVSMYLYSKGDMLNRAITLTTAEKVIEDLLVGNGGAVSAVRRLPTQLQRSLRKSLQAGDTKTAIRDMAEHLNASTQYNYNRESMSEFGRIMGPMFSTFSKWPTATVGEIMGEIRDRGFTRGGLAIARKYGAPLAALASMDEGLKSLANSDELSDRQKKLFGSYGLKGASPAGAVGDFVSGEFFSPPAVDLIYRGIIVPTLKGDVSKLESGAAQAFNAYAPGAGLVRFVTDDMVTFIEGRRPEGNFFERTAEGADRLTR